MHMEEEGTVCKKATDFDFGLGECTGTMILRRVACTGCMGLLRRLTWGGPWGFGVHSPKGW